MFQNEKLQKFFAYAQFKLALMVSKCSFLRLMLCKCLLNIGPIKTSRKKSRFREQHKKTNTKRSLRRFFNLRTTKKRHKPKATSENEEINWFLSSKNGHLCFFPLPPSQRKKVDKLPSSVYQFFCLFSLSDIHCLCVYLSACLSL